MNKDILDLRSPEDLEKFKELQDIRKAVIDYYDNYLSRHYQLIQKFLSQFQIINEETESLLWARITEGRCLSAAGAVLDYLNTNFPNKYDLSILHGVYTRFFPEHDVAVVKSKSTGNIFAISPANIVNRNSLKKYPTYNEKIFQRLTNVIFVKSVEELKEKLGIIEEGGHWTEKPWLS